MKKKYIATFTFQANLSYDIVGGNPYVKGLKKLKDTFPDAVVLSHSIIPID